jgi:hypothetical protein
MSAEDWPVEVDSAFGCWRWTGRRDRRDGRALIWRGQSPIVAYRAVYEAERGPIGEGLVLEHWCRRPDCVAPHHLEPVTQSENEKRKFYRYRARMKTCPRGHDLTVNRGITPEGGQVCRQCNREARGEGV